MSSGSAWLDNAIWEAQHTREPAGASEFGGAPGPDPHAHGNPPPSQRGYPGRYMHISEAASTSDISLGRVNRGTGSPHW